MFCICIGYNSPQVSHLCLCVFQLKESKQAVNNIRPLVDEEEDEDDVEKVSWSGEPVGSKTDLLITPMHKAEL